MSHTVLAVVSNGYSVPIGTSLRVTHPSASFHRTEVLLHLRLACVKPAASVRSELGSNSQVNSPDIQNQSSPCQVDQKHSLAQARHKLMYLVYILKNARAGERVLSRTAACASLLQVFTMSNSANAYRSKIRARNKSAFFRATQLEPKDPYWAARTNCTTTTQPSQTLF